MKGEVINFEILRIESELDKYDETGVLPLIILDGVYSLDDICTVYYDNLSKKHQKIADDLKSNYDTSLDQSISSLRLSLKKEYAKEIFVKFAFPVLRIVNDSVETSPTIVFGKIISDVPTIIFGAG